jgi:hypothetical protein
MKNKILIKPNLAIIQLNKVKVVKFWLIIYIRSCRSPLIWLITSLAGAEANVTMCAKAGIM